MCAFATNKLLEVSVAKAIALDEISAGSATTSCAEDAFFVAQRCAKRGLATGHAGAASAVVNHAANTLGENLLQALVRKVWYTFDARDAAIGKNCLYTV